MHSSVFSYSLHAASELHRALRTMQQSRRISTIPFRIAQHGRVRTRALTADVGERAHPIRANPPAVTAGGAGTPVKGGERNGCEILDLLPVLRKISLTRSFSLLPEVGATIRCRHVTCTGHHVTIV